MRKNLSLQHLSFSQCKIGDDGATKILETVQIKPNIGNHPEFLSTGLKIDLKLIFYDSLA